MPVNSGAPDRKLPAHYCTTHVLRKYANFFSGYDTPFHLSEECSNANIASPRAIALTGGVGGIMGWFLQLVVAYTVVDIEAALDSDLGQPYAAYLLQILPQKITIAILALTIICAFFMGQGCMVRKSLADNVNLADNSPLTSRSP